MRIIGGRKKGAIIKAPKNLPSRPTTDRTKESLFNILSNLYDFESLRVLDLFSGTGNISFEFASRGAKKIFSVDKDYKCISFIEREAGRHEFDQLIPVRSDAFAFIGNSPDKFDIIFMDPPYGFPLLQDIIAEIFELKVLKDRGILVVEHESQRDLSNLPNFTRIRKYGSSSLSFFEESS